MNVACIFVGLITDIVGGNSQFMRTKSGSVASGCGRERLQAALAGGGTGAPGSRKTNERLVHAIIELGRLPTQRKDASPEEKRLAVQLIRAKKAGALSSQQEDVLRILAQDQAEATAGSGVQ